MPMKRAYRASKRRLVCNFALMTARACCASACQSPPKHFAMVNLRQVCKNAPRQSRLLRYEVGRCRFFKGCSLKRNNRSFPPIPRFGRGRQGPRAERRRRVRSKPPVPDSPIDPRDRARPAGQSAIRSGTARNAATDRAACPRRGGGELFSIADQRAPASRPHAVARSRLRRRACRHDRVGLRLYGYHELLSCIPGRLRHHARNFAREPVQTIADLPVSPRPTRLALRPRAVGTNGSRSMRR